MKSKTPTKHERERMRLIKELGCIVCGSAPCHAHHLLSGGVRRGHRWTIGLCERHHVGERKEDVSYHGCKKTFHALCGYDEELLCKQDDLLRDNGFKP